MTNQDKDQIKEIKRMYEHQGDFQTAEVLFKRKNIKIAAEEMGVEYIETDPRHQTSLSFYDWQEYEKKGEYIINEVFKNPRIETFNKYYNLSQLKEGNANLNKRRSRIKIYQNLSEIHEDFFEFIESVNKLLEINRSLLAIKQGVSTDNSDNQDSSDYWDEITKVKNKAVRLYSKVHTLMVNLHKPTHNAIINGYKYDNIEPSEEVIHNYCIIVTAYTALIDTATFVAEFSRVYVITRDAINDFFETTNVEYDVQYEKCKKEYEKFNRIANRYNI